jgi:hypothetical protein
MYAADFLSNLLTADTTVCKVLDLSSILVLCRHMFSEINFVTLLFLCSSRDAVIEIKPRRTRWVRHVSHIGKTSSYKIIFRKPKRKSPIFDTYTYKGELY